MWFLTTPFQEGEPPRRGEPSSAVESPAAPRADSWNPFSISTFLASSVKHPARKQGGTCWEIWKVRTSPWAPALCMFRIYGESRNKRSPRLGSYTRDGVQMPQSRILSKIIKNSFKQYLSLRTCKWWTMWEFQMTWLTTRRIFNARKNIFTDSKT